MEEMLFENQIRYTKAICTESCKKIYALLRALYFIFPVFTILLSAWSVLCSGGNGFLLFALFLSIAVFVFAVYMPSYFSGRMLRRQQLINSASEPAETVRFYQDYFEVQAENGGLSKFSYLNISRVLETNHLIILKLGPGMVQLVDKTAFSKGDASAFKLFIQQKGCPGTL